MSNENLGSRLEEIVRRLGRYYGAMSRSDFVSMLLLGSSSMPTSPYEIPDPTPAQIAAQALLDISEGAFTMPSLIQRLDNLVAGSQNEDADANDIPSLVKICYEPDLIGDNDKTARAVLRSSARPQVRLHDGTIGAQGVYAGGDTGDQAFSIRHIGGFGASVTPGADRPAVSINETGTPTGGSAHIDCSIVQVFANRLTPASRDLGALTLFMNAMPTLEISRAIPFIDVVLIQEGDHFRNDRITSLSLGQFFMGNSIVPIGTQERTMLSANDAIVAAENASLPEFERTVRDRVGTERIVRSPISTAGMELFTSPQTLINSNEEHQELDAFSESNEEQLRRQTPVIDKFRPLMSLKSVSFQVVGTGGMMSYKSGKMSLVLHDRSRLAEVSALVRPTRFGTTHLMIEYGWSHPDSPAQLGFATENQDNLFGSLIGALRVKEKYQIVNSSFDFDEAGQVNIELQLSMLANRAMQRAQIGLGLENVSSFQQVKYLTDMIQELRDRIPSATAQKVFGESDIIGSLTSPQGALSPLSNDAIREIRNLTALRNNGNNPDLRNLGKALTDLMGSNPNSSEGAAKKLKNEMRAKITERVSNLTKTSDPFIVPGSPSGAEKTKKIEFPSYVSLGKIFASFILEPIAASGHYKDVQVIFYNFNDKASYMANRNIATFPISKADFTTILTKELDQLVNMPIESFMNFLGTYFISDPASDAYGFNSMYAKIPTDPQEDSQRQLAERYKKNDVALFEDQQKVLRNAYNRESGDLEFKQPTISVVLESVPVRGAPEQTILRMHIVDSQATAHSTAQSFLEAASSQSIGLLNTKAIAAQQALGRSYTSPEGSGEAANEQQKRAEAQGDLDRALTDAVRIGLIDDLQPAASGENRRATQTLRDASGEPMTRYRIKGGFGKLKSFIMKTVPSMRYGEGASGILSAKVSSMNDSALSTVNMLRQGRSPENPIGTREQGIPLQVSPIECSLETIGCPLWSYGQQIFLDMGTGTTIDAIYGVTGVDHTIEPGNFKTSVKLTPMNTYARYNSLIDNIENALVVINSQTEGEPLETPSSSPPVQNQSRPRRQASRSAAPPASAAASTPSTTSTTTSNPTVQSPPPAENAAALRVQRDAAITNFTRIRNGILALRQKQYSLGNNNASTDQQALVMLEGQERDAVREINRLNNEVKRIERRVLEEDLRRKESLILERGNALTQFLTSIQALSANSQARPNESAIRALRDRERTMRAELTQLGNEAAALRERIQRLR